MSYKSENVNFGFMKVDVKIDFIVPKYNMSKTI